MYLSVFPNPFTDKLAIEATITEAGNGTLSLKDIFGKVVFERTATLVKGNNFIQINGLERLPPGVYQLSPGINGEQLSAKLGK
jgi:hypothetical protein